MSGVSVVTGAVKDVGSIVPSRSNPTASRGSNKTKASPQNSSKNTTSKVTKQVQKAKESISLEYIEGNLEVLPNPYFKAKSLYHIKGVGDPFEGVYYTKKVTHTIGGEGYTVSAEVFQVENIPSEKNTNDRKPIAKLPKSSNSQLIERVGIVTARSGLLVRRGNPFDLKVNSSGFIIGPSSKAPIIGKLKYGAKVKVHLRKGDWYDVYFGAHGGWCYSKYIKV